MNFLIIKMNFIYLNNNINNNNNNNNKNNIVKIIIIIIITISIINKNLIIACPIEVCVCKWKGGKQSVECGGKFLSSIPDGMDPNTQVLNFTGNTLQILQNERFFKMNLINLQKIYLSRNQLQKIHQNAFRGLTNLVELDLSENMLTSIPSETFTDYKALMRLTLSGNPIRELKSNAFKHLTYLTTLELSNCQIDKIEDETFIGMDNLEWLRLDGNRIQTIRGQYVLPKSLHGINLQDNRWTCDCYMIDIHSWLINYNIPQQIEEPKCMEPKRLRGQIIKNLQADELACLPDITPTTLYLEISEGKNISLLCKITAIPEAQISWWYQGIQLQNDTMLEPNFHLYYYIEDGGVEEKRTELFIYNINPDDNGTFSCIAENSAGRTQANYTIRVIVKEEPIAEQVLFPYEYFLLIIIGAGIAGFLIVLCCCCIILKCRQRTKRIGKRKITTTGSAATTTTTTATLGGNNTIGSTSIKLQSQSIISNTGGGFGIIGNCTGINNGGGGGISGSIISSGGGGGIGTCKDSNMQLDMGGIGNNLNDFTGNAIPHHSDQITSILKSSNGILNNLHQQDLMLYVNQSTSPTQGLSIQQPSSTSSVTGIGSSVKYYNSPPSVSSQQSLRNYTINDLQNPDLINDTADNKKRYFKTINDFNSDDGQLSDHGSISGGSIKSTNPNYYHIQPMYHRTGTPPITSSTVTSPLIISTTSPLTTKTPLNNFSIATGSSLQPIAYNNNLNNNLNNNNELYQHQIDVHLNPGCFLGQSNYYHHHPVEYHRYHTQQQQQQQPLTNNLISKGANPHYYRTLPHKLKHQHQQQHLQQHQVLSTTNSINNFRNSFNQHNGIRYSLEAEFLTRTSTLDTPPSTTYSIKDLRYTVDGYPKQPKQVAFADQQYPSPPDGYKISDILTTATTTSTITTLTTTTTTTSSSSLILSTTTQTSQTISSTTHTQTIQIPTSTSLSSPSTSSTAIIQQWPSCLPGYHQQQQFQSQIVPIKTDTLKRYPSLKTVSSASTASMKSANTSTQLSTTSSLSSSSSSSTSSGSSSSTLASISSPASSASSSSSTSCITKRCVAQQTSDTILEQDNEDGQIDEEHNSTNSNSKLRHLTGPLADSPDEGYVGDSQDSSDM